MSSLPATHYIFISLSHTLVYLTSLDIVGFNYYTNEIILFCEISATTSPYEAGSDAIRRNKIGTFCNGL